MSATSISTLTAYAQPADLLARVDWRQLGDWVSDIGGSSSDTRPSYDSVAANSAIAAALTDASGELEAAVSRGGRNLPADFASLTGNSLNHLIWIVCMRAKYRLWCRRTRKGESEEAPPGCKEAAEELERLARGEHVFAFQENVQDAAGGTVQQWDGKPLVPTPQAPASAAATPYFGYRFGCPWWGGS